MFVIMELHKDILETLNIFIEICSSASNLSLILQLGWATTAFAIRTMPAYAAFQAVAT
jgi:hypothetical protein